MNFRLILSIVGIFVGGFLIFKTVNNGYDVISAEINLKKESNPQSVTNIANETQNLSAGEFSTDEKKTDDSNVKIIENRFTVKGDIPQEKIEKIIKKMKSGNISPDDPEIILLKPAANLDEKPLAQAALDPAADPSIVAQTPTIPENYKNICPYNKKQGSQCGGLNAYDKIRHENCRDIRPLAFYTQCNYGQWPAYVNDPRDYTAQCSGVDSGNCACNCTVLKLGDRCPPVLTCIRKIGNKCVVMPHSCEQCCASGTWIWDDVTGGCACQTPP